MSGVVPESFKVAATLAAFRLVGLNGTENTVAYPTTITSHIIGVTSDDVKDINQAIPVKTHGRAKLQFGDSVASGALVAAASDGTGKGVPFVGVTSNFSYVAGNLIGAKVNTADAIGEIFCNPSPLWGKP